MIVMSCDSSIFTYLEGPLNYVHGIARQRHLLEGEKTNNTIGLFKKAVITAITTIKTAAMSLDVLF